MKREKKIGLLLPYESAISDYADGKAATFAERFERALKSHGAYPKRKSQLQIIGSTAALYVHAKLLAKALENLVATESSSAGKRTFEDRLIDVAAQVECTYAFSRHVRKPFVRMVNARCDDEGEVIILSRAAETSLRGMTKK